MLIAKIKPEAFDLLNTHGFVVVEDCPAGCSGRDHETMIEEIVAGKVPACEITETMILNGQKMLVFVHHLSDNGEESACCRWSKIAFEKVC